MFFLEKGIPSPEKQEKKEKNETPVVWSFYPFRV